MWYASVVGSLDFVNTGYRKSYFLTFEGGARLEIKNKPDMKDFEYGGK